MQSKDQYIISAKYFFTGISLLFIALLSTVVYADSFRTRLNQVVSDKSYAADTLAEIRFGKQVAARILGRESLHDNLDLTRYINLIGKSLVFNSSRSELEFHFAIINNPYPNAYSAPGGYVFITLGAIQQAQDEAELAAVLAHEVAHISQRHIVKELNIKSSETSGIAGFSRLLGAASDTTRIALTQAVDKAMTILFDSGYKINEELDADRVAALLLAQTGYDPTALERYLQRIHHSESETRVSNNTHPSSEARFQALYALAKAEGFEQLQFPRLQQRFEENTRTSP